MAHLRRLYRISAIILWTLFLSALSVPYRFMGWEGSRRISRLLRLWSKGTAGILGLKIKVYGVIPDVSNGLVVSNHLGYMDVITHGTVLPLRFTSSTEIEKQAVLGRIIALSRPIWVDRKFKPASQKAAREFAKTMKQGIYLIVYPEGTSTDGKNGILPFKSTPFEAAIANDMPILPILTRYNETPDEPTVCWYGDMTFLPHAWEVLKLRSIEAELHFLEPVFPEGRARKELAAFVHEVMAREYEKIHPLKT